MKEGTITSKIQQDLFVQNSVSLITTVCLALETIMALRQEVTNSNFVQDYGCLTEGMHSKSKYSQ